MTQKEHPFVVLCHVPDGRWTFDTLFETMDDAKDEIKCLISSYPPGVVNPKDFVIAPNDFDKLRAFRPLDYGDAIYSGKPKGDFEKIILWHGGMQT